MLLPRATTAPAAGSCERTLPSPAASEGTRLTSGTSCDDCSVCNAASSDRPTTLGIARASELGASARPTAMRTCSPAASAVPGGGSWSTTRPTSPGAVCTGSTATRHARSAVIASASVLPTTVGTSAAWLLGVGGEGGVLPGGTGTDGAVGTDGAAPAPRT